MKLFDLFKTGYKITLRRIADEHGSDANVFRAYYRASPFEEWRLVHVNGHVHSADGLHNCAASSLEELEGLIAIWERSIETPVKYRK